NRAGLDGHTDRAQMLDHVVQRNCRNHAEVARAERRLPSLRRCLRRAILKIDLLIAEAQRESRLAFGAAKELSLETECALVEAQAFADVAHGQHNVIQAIGEWAHRYTCR